VALGGNKRADLGPRPRIDDVTRFDPAPPRRHDAELHLPVEHLGAMAIAVDGHFRASGDRAPRERAVKVQVRRCAVDFDERLRLDGGFEEPVVIELVGRPVGNESVGWVIIDTSGCRIAAM
jgi:hypothetical protein